MKTFRIKLDNVQPEIGIFTYVDGRFVYKSMPYDASMPESILNELQHADETHRGKVEYDAANDRFHVTMHSSLNVAEIRNVIINSFRLPRNKIVWLFQGETE